VRHDESETPAHFVVRETFVESTKYPEPSATPGLPAFSSMNSTLGTPFEPV
jgi:hypothetical protein